MKTMVSNFITVSPTIAFSQNLIDNTVNYLCFLFLRTNYVLLDSSSNIFQLGQFKQKLSVLDASGKPVITKTDSSNPWWALLENAVQESGGKLGKPEIFPASTDARYFRRVGLPAIGFSPMANTPILLHDHNEVTLIIYCMLN